MPDSPYQYFLGRRNAACVRLLEQNEDVNEFFRAMLEHLVDFANTEGIQFSDIKIDRPYITNDGYIRGRLVR